MQSFNSISQLCTYIYVNTSHFYVFTFHPFHLDVLDSMEELYTTELSNKLLKIIINIYIYIYI